MLAGQSYEAFSNNFTVLSSLMIMIFPEWLVVYFSLLDGEYSPCKRRGAALAKKYGGKKSATEEEEKE